MARNATEKRGLLEKVDPLFGQPKNYLKGFAV
jgi:hypothetical protein